MITYIALIIYIKIQIINEKLQKNKSSRLVLLKWNNLRSIKAR